MAGAGEAGGSQLPIPERWLRCPRRGNVVPGTPFLPFKVPLDGRYDGQVPEECRWNVAMLLARFRGKVGLVIDLTKTDRFYDKAELPDELVVQKLECAGHGESPTLEQARVFRQICSRFMERHPDKLIGVHCTHGYNRTGFMIVSYLVEENDVSVEQAIRRFAKARDPGIYKDHYIQDLCERYQGDSTGLVPVPTPSWSRSDAEQNAKIREAIEILSAAAAQKGEGEGEGEEDAAQAMDDDGKGKAEQPDAGGAATAGDGEGGAATSEDKAASTQQPALPTEAVARLAAALRGALEAAVDSTLAEVLEDHGWSGLDFRDPAEVGVEGLLTSLRVAFPQAEDASGRPGIEPTSESCEDETAVAKGVFSIPGIEPVPPPEQGPLRRRCREMVGAPAGTAFPGAQPVSMDEENVRRLGGKEDYLVSWKADGTRYMLMILGKAGVYMVGRDNSVFKLPFLFFPRLGNSSQYLDNTLLDGEMVIDRHVDRGKTIVRPRYLAYDLIVYETARFQERPYSQRLRDLEEKVLKPRDKYKATHKMPPEVCGVRLKRFFPLTEMNTSLAKLIARLTHENDGLIFAPEEQPYKAGPCDGLLKWKPPSLNSIDFFCQVTTDPITAGATVATLYVTDGGAFTPFTKAGVSTIQVTDKKAAARLKACNGKIVECTWKEKEKLWKFLKVRTDKTHPNSYRTAAAVFRSIVHGVERAEILVEIQRKFRGTAHGARHPSHPRPPAGEQRGQKRPAEEPARKTGAIKKPNSVP